MRKQLLALAATLVLTGCASEGGKIATGSLKPNEGTAKVRRDKPSGPVQASPPDDARKLYCDEVRRSWKPGDMPPTTDALEKRKADNIYCSG